MSVNKRGHCRNVERVVEGFRGTKAVEPQTLACWTFLDVVGLFV